MKWNTRQGMVLVLCALGLPTAPGCGVAPKAFSALGKDQSAINRARAVELGQGKVEEKVIPRLIESLEDTDPVVRMTAHEDLKQRTRQDFGFVPWADAAERTPAVEQWKAWWRSARSAVTKTAGTP